MDLPLISASVWVEHDDDEEGMKKIDCSWNRYVDVFQE